MKKFLCAIFGHRYLEVFNHVKTYKSHSKDTAQQLTTYYCIRCTHQHAFKHVQEV
jgi:tRNA G26 N,N-dimethylase Trm1